MADDFEEHTVIADREGVHRLAAASGEHAYVIVIAGHGVGEMHKVDGPMIVGRGQDADVRLIDDSVSRHHATLEPRDGGVVVRDLGSTNGTMVNGAPVGERMLRDGDKILVGTTTILKFTYHDDLEESFQRQMYESALRDGLTRAFNRKYFGERLKAEFAYSKRHGSALTLMLFDLDHFKAINDGHGHLAGDHVLTTIAAALHDAIRSEDVFARYGGEEFAVLSRGTGVDSGVKFAERIRRAVADYPFRYEGVRLPVTISVGVASVPDEAIADPFALLDAADQALYAAKRNGRNRVELFDPGVRPTTTGTRRVFRADDR